MSGGDGDGGYCHFEIENEIITNLVPFIRAYGAANYQRYSLAEKGSVNLAYDELRQAIYRALERAYAAGLAKKETARGS